MLNEKIINKVERLRSEAEELWPLSETRGITQFLFFFAYITLRIMNKNYKEVFTMNTNAMLKQLKEKLNSLEEILKSEHERLTTILEGIEIVENNKHILDEEGKRIHLNTIEMYNEQVDIHNMQIIEYNQVRKEYNRCVAVQDILDRD